MGEGLHPRIGDHPRILKNPKHQFAQPVVHKTPPPNLHKAATFSSRHFLLDQHGQFVLPQFADFFLLHGQLSFNRRSPVEKIAPVKLRQTRCLRVVDLRQEPELLLDAHAQRRFRPGSEKLLRDAGHGNHEDWQFDRGPGRRFWDRAFLMRESGCWVHEKGDMAGSVLHDQFLEEFGNHKNQ